MPNGAELAGGQAPQISPGQVQGIDPSSLIPVLQQAIQASVDEAGFVDIQQLAAVWPQVAQQAGLNLPFQTVLQLIEQNPEIIQDLVTQMGLAGINVNGRQIGAEELAGIGTGAVGSPGVQTQG